MSTNLMQAQEHLMALRCSLRRAWAGSPRDIADAAYELLRKTEGLSAEIRKLIEKETEHGNPDTKR